MLTIPSATLAPKLVARDLFSLPVVHGVSVSPDGRHLAYVVTTMDVEKDAYRGSVRIKSLGDGAVRTYTRGTARDVAPRWSPAGNRLSFISDRSGRRQVWLVDVDGGEPYQAPPIAADVSTASFSPSGRYIAAVATPDTNRRDVVMRGWRRIERLRYRADGLGYLDDKPQLWLIDLQAGDACALTDGSGSVSAPAWSPDGRRIAFAASNRPDADSIFMTELCIVDAQPAATPRRVCSLRGALDAPAWSNDAAKIAFTGHDDPAYSLGTIRLYSVAPDGANLKCLTADAEWSCGNAVLSDLESAGGSSAPHFDRGDSMVVLGTRRGSAALFRVNAAGSATQLTPSAQSVSEFSAAAGTIAIAASDSQTPPEAYVSSSHDSDWQRVTDETKAWRHGKNLAAAATIEVRGQGGPIDAWRLQGDGPSPRPCVLQIHGGPHAAYGHAFFFEFQLLAAAGYDVVYANPRGSQGYGDAFNRAIAGDWAAPAFDDCMRALDAAIADGSVDPGRLGIAGGSYGGYLTAWTIGHTDRFRAAIAMRPATNLTSLWGTSEVGRMLEGELGATPFDDAAIYRKLSPLTYADSMRTPLLLIHAEYDYRCPIEQSEQLFAALKKRGARVEFLRFLEGDHGLSRTGPPRLREARLTAIIEWFDRHFAKAL